MATSPLATSRHERCRREPAPLYLVNVRGMPQPVMAWLMSMFGLTSMVFAFLVPGSWDMLDAAAGARVLVSVAQRAQKGDYLVYLGCIQCRPVARTAIQGSV